jgi:mono/diheme cytochrome c family protein
VWLIPLLLSGCQQKMAAQPSFDDFQACDLFPDGTTARPLPDGVVARGYLPADQALFTGRVVRDSDPSTVADSGAAPQSAQQEVLANEARAFTGVVDTFPIPITRQVVEHGRNRYMIYCSVCHDPLGTGHGKIVERGYTRPPSYHIERLRQAPAGHLFRVISEGYGSMPSYAAQIPVRDRWAIAAYVRALQLSQHFPEGELPDELRRKFNSTNPRAGG